MVLPPKKASGRRDASQPHSILVDQGVWVSPHALDRVREHHPNAGVRGALALLTRAQEVEPGLIAPFLGRRLEAVRDRYLISADRCGAFVIVRAADDAHFRWTMRTYLRFDAHQEAVAAQLLDGPHHDDAGVSDPVASCVFLSHANRRGAA